MSAALPGQAKAFAQRLEDLLTAVLGVVGRSYTATPTGFVYRGVSDMFPIRQGTMMASP